MIFYSCTNNLQTKQRNKDFNSVKLKNSEYELSIVVIVYDDSFEVVEKRSDEQVGMMLEVECSFTRARMNIQGIDVNRTKDSAAGSAVLNSSRLSTVC